MRTRAGRAGLDVARDAGDRWLAGDAYEAYMGRWSRQTARLFLAWVRPMPQAHWLEIGCGTGALTSAICARGEPASVTACDPSASFVAYAREHVADPRVSFAVAGSDDVPRQDGGFDVAVSGLVLNFLPDPEAAVKSLRERVREGGILAAYVWDYAGGMEWLRVFWDEATALDPRAAALDEGQRFPLCAAPALAALFRGSGLAQVDTTGLEIPTEFETFDDYWRPFLDGTGPAPSYVVSLDGPSRARLRARLAQRLPAGSGGHIRLRARAWAVRGLAV